MMRTKIAFLSALSTIFALGISASLASSTQAQDGDGSQLIHVLAAPVASPNVFGVASGIALAPDGRIAVLTGPVEFVPRVTFFDSDGQLLDFWRLDATPRLNADQTWDIEFAQDGSLLVGTRGYVERWDDGARVARWGLPQGMAANGRSVELHPYRIRMHPDGEIYVSAGQNEFSRIFRFDAEGTLLGEIGEGGNGEAQFNQPAGFTFDAAGHLYVADSRNHRIQHYDSEGKWLGNWGEMGTEPGQFNQPTDIRKLPEGFLVVDRLNHRLQWFSDDGEALSTSSGQGAVPGRLNGVWEAEVTPDGEIWALDSGNGRVLELDEAGVSMMAVGEPYQPSVISDFALNDAGELILADSNLGQVLQLSAQGAYRGTFGETGSEAHEFRPGALQARLQLASDDSVWLAGMQLSSQDFSTSTGLVQHFDASGTYLGSFDGAAEGVPAFNGIQDMRLARGGAGESDTLWVLDDQEPHVRQYAPDGSLLRAFAGKGTQPGYLTRPVGLARVPGQEETGELEILISDLYSWQRFGQDGSLRGAIRHTWPEECDVDTSVHPVAYSLRQSADGRLIAWTEGALHGYAPDGSRLGPLREGLRFPHDAGSLAATDASGRMYIADRFGRVEVFSAPNAERVAPYWVAAWHDNAWLADWPARAGALEAADPDALELSWSEGDAPEGMEDGSWSARISRPIHVDEGDTWSIALSAEGGAQLLIDGAVIADGWRDAAFDWEGEHEFWPGTHLIEIRLRDSVDAASLSLELSSLGRPPSTFTPAPVATQPPSATPLPPTPTATPVPPSTPWSVRMPYRIHLPFMLLAGQGSGVEPAPPWTSAGEIDVTNYTFRFTVPALGEDIQVEGGILLQARQRLTSIRLDAEPSALDITSVRVDGQPRPFTIMSGKANDYGLTGSKLIISLESPLEPGEEAAVSMSYRILAESLSGDKGLMLATDFQQIPVLITRNFPYYTRFFLPSHDHPSDPATFRIELKVPVDMVGASIGELVDGSYEGGGFIDDDGLRVFRWGQETPIPTYGLNIAIGPFLVESGELCYDPDARDAMPLDCAAPNASEPVPWVGYGLSDNSFGKPDMALAGRALIHHAQHFGAYPFAKLGLVTAPHPYSNANPSLITIVGNHTTVHEVAHSWWGNGIQHYAAGWGEGWLSEGLSNYSDVLFKEVVEHEVARADCSCREGELLGPVDIDPWAYYGGTGRTGSLYCGGQAAFHDLRARIAAELDQPVWREGPRNVLTGVLAAYFEAYQGQPAGSAELLEIMTRELPASMAEEGGGMTREEAGEFVDAWAADWVY